MNLTTSNFMGRSSGTWLGTHKLASLWQGTTPRESAQLGLTLTDLSCWVDRKKRTLMWSRPSRKRSGPGLSLQRCACGASQMGTPFACASWRAVFQIFLTMSRTLALRQKRFLQPAACTGGQVVTGGLHVAWGLSGSNALDALRHVAG